MFMCVHVGLLCVQRHACDRPNMSSVVLMFGKGSQNVFGRVMLTAWKQSVKIFHSLQERYI